MKKTPFAVSLFSAVAALALLSQGALAQDPPKTRADVKADAKKPNVSTMNSSAETGASTPGASKSGKARADVKADTKKPTSTSVMNSEAESGASTPGASKSGKARADVKADTKKPTSNATVNSSAETGAPMTAPAAMQKK